MADNPRTQRILDDIKALEALREASSIFDFVQGDGDPPKQFTLIFHGKGLKRDRTQESERAEVEEHRCELRLGYGYPEQPPELRWITPIYHPNITYSGFVQLKCLGLPWEKAIGLDVVCERVWDAARLAYFDLKQAVNYNAKDWLESQLSELTLPVDPRPLRDGPAENINAGSNVVRYNRVGHRNRQLELPPEVELAARPDVFFVEESEQPIRFESPVRDRAAPPSGQAQNRDDDILFIE